MGFLTPIAPLSPICSSPCLSRPQRVASAMKLLPSLAIGLGLVGAGLTAPVPTPHLVPLDDGLLVAVDAVLEPSWPDSYAERLSRYASAAVQRLRVFQVTPVFAVDPDDAPVITEDDGEVVLVGDNQWLGAVVWDPSTRILSLDPMSCLVVSVAATHLPVPAQV